jgi:5-formyltetrahydrofolate cyclo-ligase
LAIAGRETVMQTTIDKRALRARIRAERDRFFGQSPAPIAAPAALLALLEPGRIVTSYIPIGSEADPQHLAAAALAAGCRLALPHITTREAPMRFLGWDGYSALVEGRYGLSQPPSDAPEVVPDIILTPLLAFDAKLDRLGQGAGYYYRAFATFPDAWRIGVAWSVQQVESLRTEAWDMPLHAVITECGWIPRP